MYVERVGIIGHETSRFSSVRHRTGVLNNWKMIKGTVSRVCSLHFEF